MKKMIVLVLGTLIAGLIVLPSDVVRSELNRADDDSIGRKEAYSVVNNVGNWKRAEFRHVKDALSSDIYILQLHYGEDFTEHTFKSVSLLIDGKAYVTKEISSKVAYMSNDGKLTVSSVTVGLSKEVARKLLSAKKVTISVSMYGPSLPKAEVPKSVLDEWEKVIKAF